MAERKTIEKQNGLFTLVDEHNCSPQLINKDLKPTSFQERTWSKWHIASLWVGMSVCIPTYMLASSMITGGLSWKEAMMMILLGNLIVSVPMVLNGHAGTRYGIPFPVLGRAAFGVFGVHVPSIFRALVACGWFGIQTWLGGLAIAAIFGAISGDSTLAESSTIQFVGFGLFWAIQMVFVLKGTESIKWLETLAAPLLILIGFFMLMWGIQGGGGLSKVLDSSYEFSKPTLSFNYIKADDPQQGATLRLNLMKDKEGKRRASEWKWILVDKENASTAQDQLTKASFKPLDKDVFTFTVKEYQNLNPKSMQLHAQFRSSKATSKSVHTSLVPATSPTDLPWLTYLFWLTAMVAFWATLALNISDITRYAASQKDQIWGQFLGLPTTMTLYAFIGVAVTCAAIVILMTF
jgi:cytosine/uracil/thiamine/allantoin permease